MSESLWLYRRRRRVFPIRFRRAATGNPQLTRPDIDDRGYRANEHAPVVGISQGDTVIVKLERVLLDDAAPLHVTSSNPAIAEVVTPASGTALSGAADHDIHIRGVAGGRRSRPRSADIEVRHGSGTGPVLGRITADVFRVLTVNLTIHWVTISQAGVAAAGTAPPNFGGGANAQASVTNLMTMANAIWRPCGINLNAGAPLTPTVALTATGIVNDTNPGGFPGELPTLMANTWPNGTANYVANTINVWIVNQIGTGNTLGYGFARSNFAGFGLPNPGIILGARTAGGARGSLYHWANDVAHEVGHFLRLRHFSRREQPREREDTWSRRMLMHPFNSHRTVGNWPAQNAAGQNFRLRPRFDNTGYGAQGTSAYRGALVTLKNLPHIRGDAERGTARTTVLGRRGPY